jgi:hypothetical protein
MEDESHLVRKGLKDVNQDKYRNWLFEHFTSDDEGPDDMVYEILDKIDFDYLYAGAQDIAEVAKRIADSIEHLSFPNHVLKIKSRQGLIVIGTAGDDKYELLEPPLLLIDGGGNDEYLFSGTNSTFPVTVIVDAAGNDRYISTDTAKPGIAGAVLGMSVLIDKSGDDHYESVSVAQGAGLFGVGLLMDYSGDDTYTGNKMVQGAGFFGIGIAADSAGSDSLYCIMSSQGFGYTKGIGLLVNFEGNDRYVAEDDTLLNASSQSPEHNLSLAQGSAFGKRADYVDGHSWAGGVGILCDVSGDDQYSAGLFSQGCAYWFAVAMLIDGSGNDNYNGVWYVQGSGAHFGVALLDDFDGDDTYTASHNMAVGAGHDFTIGYLNERGGNDTYTVPNLSLGGGNANGIGIFHDHSGDDSYTTKGGTTLGRANAVRSAGVRANLHVWGVFVDGGGTDQYDQDYAGNASRWIGPESQPETPNALEIGVGIDR